MSIEVETQKAQALATATAWWEGRTFPLTPYGGPYPCSVCGRPIARREGTSLIGTQMRCPECTQSYFAAAEGAEVARQAVPAGVPEPRPPVAEEAVSGGPPPVPVPPPGFVLPPAPAAPSRAPRRGRRTWIVVVAVAAVVGLVAAGLLLWAPWKPAPPRGGPAAVHVVSVTTDSVTIGWTAPSGQPTPDRYDVVASGSHEVVESVPGSTTTYQVTGLEPDTGYAFQVVAYWGDQRSLYSAEVVGTTSTPPVADARLSGSMPVQITVTGSTGALNSGLAWSDSWSFTPACATGPCATSLDGGLTPPGYNAHSFQVQLNQNGAGYSGTATAHITHCGPVGSEVDVNDSVTVTLTVTSGAVTDGSWLANAWNGTLKVDSPYTAVAGGYCPAESMTMSLSSAG